MADIVLHPSTKEALDGFIRDPSHAILMVGPAGSGKSFCSRVLAASLVGREADDLEKYQYLTVISPIDNKQISIEQVRELQHIISLKIPGKQGIARIILIEDAHQMTTEAQNALLKTLEEPPLDTVLILTASSPEVLLDTIRSRVRQITVVPPAVDELKAFLGRQYDPAEVDKTLMVTGGLPGLSQALLADQDAHPLLEAVRQARSLLQSKAYERLAAVDALSKQKQLCQDICFILGQMSRMALMRNTAGSAAANERWQRILEASYLAGEQLRHNVQAKLVLINLMLEL